MTEQANPQNNRFCTNCGVQLQAGIYCHACGREVHPPLPDQDTIIQHKQQKFLSSTFILWLSVALPPVGSLVIGSQAVKLKVPIWYYILLCFGFILIEFGFVPLLTNKYLEGTFQGNFTRLIPGIIVQLVIGLLLWGNYKYLLRSYSKSVAVNHKKIFIIAATALIFGAYFMLTFISDGGSMQVAVYGQSEIKFGIDRDRGKLLNIGTKFKPNQEMHFSFRFPNSRGGSFAIIIEEHDGASNRVIDHWEDNVPPDWKGITNTINAPIKSGKYTMKVIKDNDVIAKGSFEVQKSKDYIFPD